MDVFRAEICKNVYYLEASGILVGNNAPLHILN